MHFFQTLHHLWDEWGAERCAEWADTHLRHGDYTKAVETATRGLIHALHPDNIYFTRGRAKMMLGDFEGALDDFDACLGVPSAAVMKPDRAVIYAYRAWVHWQRGDICAALGDANLALYLDPRQSIASNVRRLADAAQFNGWRVAYRA
ncbi:MAG: hypothetical protein SGI73_22695 [Chloroflexota bacterium]|nr:hypothetical protein [Chloroflexota bacterium]